MMVVVPSGTVQIARFLHIQLVIKTINDEDTSGIESRIPCFWVALLTITPS